MHKTSTGVTNGLHLLQEARMLSKESRYTDIPHCFGICMSMTVVAMSLHTVEETSLTLGGAMYSNGNVMWRREMKLTASWLTRRSSCVECGQTKLWRPNHQLVNREDSRLQSQPKSARSFQPTSTVIDLASEKGASSWQSGLPVKNLGFHLHKSAFRNTICLRYGRRPEHIPANVCPVHRGSCTNLCGWWLRIPSSQWD